MQTSYTDARARFAELLARAGDDLETVIITRRDRPDVALVSAAELRSLEEVAHLFRSPVNARRLLEAIARSEDGALPLKTLEELRSELGLRRD
jgi:antitoxin YefM